MVQKPAVRTWHREEFQKGNKSVIPPEALAILEAEKAAEKATSQKQTPKPDKETKAE